MPNKPEGRRFYEKLNKPATSDNAKQHLDVRGAITRLKHYENGKKTKPFEFRESDSKEFRDTVGGVLAFEQFNKEEKNKEKEEKKLDKQKEVPGYERFTHLDEEAIKDTPFGPYANTDVPGTTREAKAMEALVKHFALPFTVNSIYRIINLFSDEEILEIQGVGKKSLKAIKEFFNLNEEGLKDLFGY